MNIEEIQAAMAAITDGAENRSLTDEEVEQYESLERDLERANKSIEIRSRQKAYVTPVANRVHTASDSNPDDVLERAFEDYLRTGNENADIMELRAQSEGTNSAGGYTVPETFRNKIVERMKSFGGLSTVVETIVTASGEPMKWVSNDDTANSAEVVAENAAPASAGADLVFGEITLGAYKYVSTGTGNLPLKVPFELIEDSAIDIQSYIAKKLGERIQRKQANDWVNGSGSSQPVGIIHGLTGVQTAANTGPTYTDLVNWVHSMDPAYLANAKWAMNFKSLGYFQKLVDGNGRPILNDSTSGLGTSMGGTTLLGYPVVVDQAFPDMNVASATVVWGVFGDLQEAYIIRRVRDIQIQVFNELYAVNGQRGFMAWARADGNINDPNAYVGLTGKV